jgi:hypothetical protein
MDPAPAAAPPAAPTAPLSGGAAGGVGDAAKFGVLTVSDRASAGVYEDLSGPAILRFFAEAVASPWEAEYRVVADERPDIEAAIADMARPPPPYPLMLVRLIMGGGFAGGLPPVLLGTKSCGAGRRRAGGESSGAHARKPVCSHTHAHPHTNAHKHTRTPSAQRWTTAAAAWSSRPAARAPRRAT